MFMGPFRSRVGDWRTSGLVVVAVITLVLGGFLNWWLHPRVVTHVVYQWTDAFAPELGRSYDLESAPRLVEVFNSQLTTEGELGVSVELNLPQQADPLMRWYPRLVYPRNEVIWVDQLPPKSAVFVQAGDGSIKLLLSAPRPDTRLPDRTFAQFCSVAQ